MRLATRWRIFIQQTFDLQEPASVPAVFRRQVGGGAGHDLPVLSCIPCKKTGNDVFSTEATCLQGQRLRWSNRRAHFSTINAGLLIDLHPPRRRMLVDLIKLRAGTSTSMIQRPVWETAVWDWPTRVALSDGSGAPSQPE